MYNPEKAKENIKGLLARLEREYGRKYSVTTEETGSGFGWKVKAYGSTVAWITLRNELQCKRVSQTRDIDVEFPIESYYSTRHERYAYRSDSSRLYERIVEAIEAEHDRENARKVARERRSFDTRVLFRMIELMPESAPFEIASEKLLLRRGGQTVGRFEIKYSKSLVFTLNHQVYKVDDADIFMYFAEWVECARLAFDVAIHELQGQ